MPEMSVTQDGSGLAQDVHEAECRRRVAMIAGLRALADFLDAHPQVPCGYGMSMNTFASSKAELAEIARTAPKWRKSFSGEYAFLVQDFGGGVTYEVNINRETVCRKIVTGTHVEPERIVEDIVWECTDSLLGGDL